MGSLTKIDTLEKLEYKKEMVCREDTYWNILEYLNGIKGPRLPGVSENGDIFYFFNQGFLKISRKQEKIFLFNVNQEITKELERRLGIN